MARWINHRGHPKKRINRYNPNAPDWAAVHRPWWGKKVLPPLIVSESDLHTLVNHEPRSPQTQAPEEV